MAACRGGDENGDYVRWYGHIYPVTPTNEQRCTTDGTVNDVTANVQSVVDRGITSFLFDNAKDPGGIFSADGSELLSEISDPASGYPKHVSITYNAGCGSSKAIQTQDTPTLYPSIFLGVNIYSHQEQ